MNDFAFTEKLLKKITGIVNQYIENKSQNLANRLFPKYGGSIEELKQIIKEEMEAK